MQRTGEEHQEIQSFDIDLAEEVPMIEEIVRWKLIRRASLNKKGFGYFLRLRI
jgi:hypothetical protein